MKESRKRRIKKAFEKPWVFYLLIIFVLYIGLNIFINQIYVTDNILTSLRIGFLIPFLLFNFLIVPGLVALTVVLAILRFKEAGPSLKNEKGSDSRVGASATGLGIFVGVLGGACPGCFVGLFPAFLGLFGVTASLSVLPLYGLEIQILSTILLITAIFLLTKDIVCKIPSKSKKKR